MEDLHARMLAEFDRMEASLHEIGQRLENAVIAKFDRAQAQLDETVSGMEQAMTYIEPQRLGQLSPNGTPGEPGPSTDSPGKGLTPEQQQREIASAGKVLDSKGITMDDSAGRSRFDDYSRSTRQKQQDRGRDL